VHEQFVPYLELTTRGCWERNSPFRSTAKGKVLSKVNTVHDQHRTWSRGASIAAQHFFGNGRACCVLFRLKFDFEIMSCPLTVTHVTAQEGENRSRQMPPIAGVRDECAKLTEKPNQTFEQQQGSMGCQLASRNTASCN